MEKLNSIHVHALSVEQLACLASDALRSIVETLAQGPALSRRELSQRLGRPESSLQYQINRLKSVGLVVEDGRRPSTRRPELLYRLVSPRLSSAAATETVEGRRALAQAGRRIAMASGRAFAKAVSVDAAPLNGPGRRAVVKRLVLTLDDDGLATLNGVIESLATIVQSPGGGGQRVTLTVVLS